MCTFEIKKIADNQDLIDKASCWFHSKWGIPSEVYKESMQECMNGCNAVPQWYVVTDNEKIIAGAGVIENDFHERKDLTPNVCAVYVDEDFRCRGIAGRLLGFICDDMSKKGIDTLYLVTDHTSFYERYNWEFLCMVLEDGGSAMARMYIRRETTPAAIGGE